MKRLNRWFSNCIGVALIIAALMSCGKAADKVIYVDAKTGIEVSAPEVPLKRIYHTPVNFITCVGGYQAYAFSSNHGLDYLWLRDPLMPDRLRKCDINTLTNGEQP